MASEEEKPLLIMLAGPNGAGKSTYYNNFLAPLDLPFINADIIAKEEGIDAREAAKKAMDQRKERLGQKLGFVTETVLSDPVGEKVNFLRDAAQRGFRVVLIYIAIGDPGLSQERVEARVLAGGHDVPSEKLAGRFTRSLENLKRAIATLPTVLIYDNSYLEQRYRLVARYEGGEAVYKVANVPDWLADVVI